MTVRRAILVLLVVGAARPVRGAPAGGRVDARFARIDAMLALPMTGTDAAVRAERLVLVGKVLASGDAGVGVLIPIAPAGGAADIRMDEAIAWENARRHLGRFKDRTRYGTTAVAAKAALLVTPVSVATYASGNARRVPEVSFQGLVREEASFCGFEPRIRL